MAYGKKTGGRTAGTPNKLTVAKREETKSFFEKILDDEVEAKFWRYFMTGYVIDPETKACVPLPLDPICFAAFKRAVEYKRGMPMQPTEIGGRGGEAISITFEAIGAKTEDFAAQARALGLAR